MLFKGWKRAIEQGPLGSGRKKKVYTHPDDEKKVVGVFRDRTNLPPPLPEHIPPPSIETLKEKFFATHIAHMLFPGDMAKVHEVSSTYDVDKEPPSIVKDKVVGEDFDYSSYGAGDAVSALIRKFKEVGLFLDDRAQNFKWVKDPTPEKPYNRRLIYVDDIEVIEPRDQGLELLKTAIESRLSGAERERALRFLSRIPWSYAPVSTP